MKKKQVKAAIARAAISMRSSTKRAERSVKNATTDAHDKLQGAAKTVEQKGRGIVTSVSSTIQRYSKKVRQTLGTASPPPKN